MDGGYLHNLLKSNHEKENPEINDLYMDVLVPKLAVSTKKDPKGEFTHRQLTAEDVVFPTQIMDIEAEKKCEFNPMA